MAIKHNNEPLETAMKKQEQSEMHIAANSKAALNTVKKVLRGDDDLRLSTLSKIAETLGLDVNVTYTRKKEAVAT